MLERRLWLGAILAGYLFAAALFALRVPAWQAPDEPAHYNYVHEVATAGRLPVLQAGDYDQAYLDRLKSQRFPPELSLAPVRYEAHQPPLYYLLQALPFRLFGGSLTALRLVSVLLGGTLVWLVYEIARLVLPARPATWLGAAAFTAFLPMHLAIAASVNNDALAEVLLAAVLLLSLRYVRLGLRGRTAPTGLDALALGLLLGLALVTKVSAYVAVPVALAAPAICWYESRGRGRGRRSEVGDQRSGVTQSPLTIDNSQSTIDHYSPFLRHFLLIALPALLIALPWYVRNAAVYGGLDILGRARHDAVVVGQLRTTDFLAQSGAGALLERFVVWSHDSFWGVFGWMGVWMDGRIYTALLAWGLVAATGFAFWIGRCGRGRREVGSGKWKVGSGKWEVGAGKTAEGVGSREEGRGSRWVGTGQTAGEGYAPTDPPSSPLHPPSSSLLRWSWLLLGLTLVLTLGVYLSYNAIFVQPQGRYLFPALPAIALAAAVGWREALRPAPARVAGILLLAAGGLAWAWGLLGSGVNLWSLFILAGSGLAALAWSLVLPRLGRGASRRLAAVAYASAFALLPGLALFALFVFIVPQLQ